MTPISGIDVSYQSQGTLLSAATARSNATRPLSLAGPRGSAGPGDINVEGAEGRNVMAKFFSG